VVARVQRTVGRGDIDLSDTTGWRHVGYVLVPLVCILITSTSLHVLLSTYSGNVLDRRRYISKDLSLGLLIPSFYSSTAVQ
jgi:hypothetical protein